MDDLVYPCCEGGNRGSWVSGSGWYVVRFGNWGLLCVFPMPDPSFVESAVRSGQHKLESSVLNDHPGHIHSKVRHYLEKLTSLIADVVARGEAAVWVDVGLDYGECMEGSQRIFPQGSTIIGVKPMAHKADAARQRWLHVINDYLQSDQFEADFISNTDVFSYFSDYRCFVATVVANLKPDGEMIVELGSPADLRSLRQVPNELGLPEQRVFLGRTSADRYFASAGLRFKHVVEEQFDTILQISKNLEKLILGRLSFVALPYTSPCRQVIFRIDREPAI